MQNRRLTVAGFAALLCVANTSLAVARPITSGSQLQWRPSAPITQLWVAPHHYTPPRPPARNPLLRYYPVRPSTKSGTWQALTAASPFGGNGAGTAILMTDGTVFVENNDTEWYTLTPDDTGSYLNGTWSGPSTLPAGYGPLYFASAILPNGDLIINGGEYNEGGSSEVETNLGALYDPFTKTWTSVSPPSGWNNIGDGQSAVLDDGTYMLGNCCYRTQALLDFGSLSWTQVGTGKADANSEEGWTLLPNGDLLTVDVIDAPNSELFNPSTDSWSSAGRTPDSLVTGEEIGPQVLRPDGTVFVIGATGSTAIYDSASGGWTAGPKLPTVKLQQLDVADGPATLLPDGNVLFPASPGLYRAPSYFFEYNGKKLVPVTAPPDANGDSTYNIRLLLLPTGQVFEDDASNEIEIYTPARNAKKAYAPVITSVPTTMTIGDTYMVSGEQLNGLSQANMYGDDVQNATNYPLVRITNDSTSHVFYARTHDFSSMPVASSAINSADFDLPATMEYGPSSLVVVTNGIASKPVKVTLLQGSAIRSGCRHAIRAPRSTRPGCR